MNADDDMVSVQRESASRLEHLDILYAGYDGYELIFVVGHAAEINQLCDCSKLFTIGCETYHFLGLIVELIPRQDFCLVKGRLYYLQIYEKRHGGTVDRRSASDNEWTANRAQCERRSVSLRSQSYFISSSFLHNEFSSLLALY